MPRTLSGLQTAGFDNLNILNSITIGGESGQPNEVIRATATGEVEFSALEALSFIGGASGEYDGTTTRTINIPS
eukprot:SAG31_NODE_40182_length_282_cov_1.136612_1_plen_73_part_10